jgi:hypothetical protein
VSVRVPDGDDGGLRKSMHSGDAALSGRNGGGGGCCCCCCCTAAAACAEACANPRAAISAEPSRHPLCLADRVWEARRPQFVE